MATSRPDGDEIATGSGRLTEERSQHQAGSRDRRSIAERFAGETSTPAARAHARRTRRIAATSRTERTIPQQHVRHERDQPAGGEDRRHRRQHHRPSRQRPSLIFRSRVAQFRERLATTNPPQPADDQPQAGNACSMRIGVGGAERGDEKTAGDKKNLRDLHQIGMWCAVHFDESSDLGGPRVGRPLRPTAPAAPMPRLATCAVVRRRRSRVSATHAV